MTLPPRVRNIIRRASIFDEDMWEPPDPVVDESVTLECPNPECPMHQDGETWHPTTEKEYQGEYPMGGTVDLYTLDAFECPECGSEGREVNTWEPRRQAAAPNTRDIELQREWYEHRDPTNPLSTGQEAQVEDLVLNLIKRVENLEKAQGQPSSTD